MIPHTLRPGRDEDKNFVGSSFRASLRNGADMAWTEAPLGQKGPATPWFDQEVDKRLATMWEHGVVIAEGEATLLGWASAIGDYLHYMYVKQPYRREGIAKAMWTWFDKPGGCTHWTRHLTTVRLDRSNKLGTPSCFYDLVYYVNYWRDLWNQK